MLQIQAHYRSQCQALVSALQQHLTPEECSYTIPTGGMFLWLTLHGLTGGENGRAKLTSEEVFKRLAAQGVVVVPGDDFHVQPQGDEWGSEGPVASDTEGVTRGLRDPCVRLTFAAASEEKMHEGIRRLAVGLRQMKSEL